MPLFNSHNIVNSNLLIWNITESESELKKSINLSSIVKSRLDEIKSCSQRKQFLGVQNLLKILNIKNKELTYNANGKPILSNKYISITHSFDYCGVVVSSKKIGVDIEKLRPKILNIKKKFISDRELDLFTNDNVIDVTKIWTIKESVYKAFGFSGLDFKNNIIVKSIDKKFNNAKVKIYKNDIIEFYNVEITNF